MRSQTVAAIKSIATEHLRAQGPSGLSLRAVARELGMSSPGIYRYYASRDELLTALIADAYNALADALADARDSAGPAPQERLAAVCERYFDWAADHRAEFGLIFGTPVPGYAAPVDGPTTQAARRFADVFFGLLDEVRGLIPSSDGSSDEDGSTEATRHLLLAARLWTRLHGVVALGLNGHLLPGRLSEADVRSLYRDTVQECVTEVARL